jgi:glyoxylase-like metal-dependent hydrolase (beta-lactamase superfamily II)
MKDGEAVAVDGTQFRVRDLGPGGDCDANSIWIMEGDSPAAFVGYLAFNRTHPCMADGHATEWLANLERVRALVPPRAVLYPGHGDPGDVSLLDAQVHYLKILSSGGPGN